jgi:hypothetical protein
VDFARLFHSHLKTIGDADEHQPVTG